MSDTSVQSAVEAVAVALCKCEGIEPYETDPRDRDEQARVKLDGSSEFVPLLNWHKFHYNARAAVEALTRLRTAGEGAGS